MSKQLIGQYKFASLKVIQTNNQYQPPNTISSKIEDLWQSAQEKYGKQLWNGINYRLEKIENAQQTYILYIGTAEYKVNYASKALAHDISQLPFDQRPNCMNISALLQTSDNKFVIGQTAANSIHGTTFALFGGSLNKDEQEINNSDDLLTYLYKELTEELQLAPSHIAATNGLGLVETDTSRIAMYVHVLLHLSSEEFINKVVINEEHDAFTILTKDEILQKHNEGTVKFANGIIYSLHQLCL